MDNKYIEQAKGMIMDRYVINRARPDHMIMSAELYHMKANCTNPKVGDALAAALDELIREGLVRESGLGIHLTQAGYDVIF